MPLTRRQAMQPGPKQVVLAMVPLDSELRAQLPSSSGGGGGAGG